MSQDLSSSSSFYSSNVDVPIANLKRPIRRKIIATDESSNDEEDKTLSELPKQGRPSVSSAGSYQEEEGGTGRTCLN
jgi:hypothetical protein